MQDDWGQRAEALLVFLALSFPPKSTIFYQGEHFYSKFDLDHILF